VPIRVVVQAAAPAPALATYPQAALGLTAQARTRPEANPVESADTNFFGRRPSGLGEAFRVLWNEFVVARRNAPPIGVPISETVASSIRVRLVPAWLSDP